MTEQDEKYVIEALEYALHGCTDNNGNAETHYNTLANAIDVVKNCSIPDVSVSLPKQMIIDEIDKRIDRLYKHSEKVKGAEKKSYEDTCTSFVLFKMWLQKQ